MLDRRLVISFSLGCMSVLFALLIATWLPFWSNTMYPESFDSVTEPHWISSGFGDTGSLIARAPEEERQLLLEILRELVKKPTDILIVLKNEENLCATVELINCKGLSNKRVMPIVDKALELQVRYESNETQRGTKTIAVASAIIAFLALVISFLNLIRRKGAAADSD